MPKKYKCLPNLMKQINDILKGKYWEKKLGPKRNYEGAYKIRPYSDLITLFNDTNMGLFSKFRDYMG